MRERLTYANVVATLALFIAVGLGGAYAAEKITKKDIAKSAVTSKAIKDKTVKGKDLKDRTVTGGKLAPATVVQPTLLNGVEGDCVWTDFTTEIAVQAVSYRRNGYGEVSFSGGAAPIDSPGGDGVCDGVGAEGAEDATILVIPPADRPARAQVFNSSSGAVIVVAGVNDLAFGSAVVPAGTMVSAVGGPANLSDVQYLAADAPSSPAPARGMERISPSQLRRLAG